MSRWNRFKGVFSSSGRRLGASAKGVFGEADFQAEIQSRIRAIAPTAQLSVVEEFEILMRMPDGDEHTLHLHNAFHAYLAEDQDRRDEVIDRYVGAYVALGSSEEATLDAMVPMVKSKAWLKDMQEAMSRAKNGDSSSLFYEQLNDELFVVYAINSAQSIRYVDADEIAGFGLPREELRALASRNLRGFVPGITIERGPLVSMVVAGGDFEASLILFPDLWERERARMKGDPVFSIPARDLLLFADSADKQGVDKLKSLAADMNNEAIYPLTDALFIAKEGRFEPFPC
jgi:uncharacterized protein YtpQ (UPF0354 family)